ncbi:MAG: Crp/Fnr family transcriptional regulator [Lysobacter sp.]|nr:Crp/Fnr family transcriptional regulator [Lysobacter sp.]
MRHQSTTIATIKALLERHPLLEPLSGPEWDNALSDATLSRILPECTHASKCCKGAGEHFTMVLEGAVRVSSLSPEGRTLSICRVQAGELCMLSLAAIYSRERLLVDLSPEGNVAMLHIPAAHLPVLLTHSEGFRTYLMSSMSRHVATLLTRIEETTFGCLKTRVLSRLRDMRNSTGCSVIAISHQELADELGNTREAVSRTLKEIERGGAVKLGRRMISLVAD